MAMIQISGHEQVLTQVSQNYAKTREFIDEHQDDESKADEIQEKVVKDLQETLVLILDNIGRQKALQALEIYKEHEKFRNKLNDIEQ